MALAAVWLLLWVGRRAAIDADLARRGPCTTTRIAPLSESIRRRLGQVGVAGGGRGGRHVGGVVAMVAAKPPGLR